MYNGAPVNYYFFTVFLETGTDIGTTCPPHNFSVTELLLLHVKQPTYHVLCLSAKCMVCMVLSRFCTLILLSDSSLGDIIDGIGVMVTSIAAGMITHLLLFLCFI